MIRHQVIRREVIRSAGDSADAGARSNGGCYRAPLAPRIVAGGAGHDIFRFLRNLVRACDVAVDESAALPRGGAIERQT